MDTAKIKTFFVNHFEKMILAGVVCASGYLAVTGFGLSHITDEHDPNSLTDRARQVKTEIDADRTDAIVNDREPTLDVVGRTVALGTPVDASPYKLSKPLQRKDSRSIVRRKDPQLKPPQELIMTTFVGSIGWQNLKSKDPEDYPLSGLHGAEAIDEEKTPKKKPKKRGLGRLGGEDEDPPLFNDDSRGREREDISDRRGAGRKFNSKNDFGVVAKTVKEHPPIPKLARMIVGAAVVPHKEIFEAYKLALGDADAYSPGRDSPLYVNFEVQRADVTKKSVDQLTDQDWTRVWTLKYYEDVAAKRWAGVAQDIVPPEFRDDQLSNWIPPVLLDDYRTFVTHPLIPMTSPDELESEEDEEEDPESNELFSDDANRRSAPRRGRTGGLSSLGSRSGGSKLSGSFGGSSGNQEEEEDPVDYKLIRFYDFHNVGIKKPKPGTKYVYRIRFSVEDPNFPLDENDSPKLNSMAPEVEQRVLALTEQFKKTRVRKYERWSPWSEPSEPVSLPSLSQQFVGPVIPGSFYDWAVAGKKVRYVRNQPTGKVVTSVYDETYGARIPFLIDVGEGSILGHEGNADVVDPITMDIKKLENARVDSSTTVVDLSGGEPLGLFEGMNQPGMMLLTDEYGSLIVADEVSDLESYRIYSYADERED